MTEIACDDQDRLRDLRDSSPMSGAPASSAKLGKWGDRAGEDDIALKENDAQGANRLRSMEGTPVPLSPLYGECNSTWRSGAPGRTPPYKNEGACFRGNQGARFRHGQLDFSGRTSSTSDLDLRLQLACVQKEQTLLQLDVEKIKLAQQEARERTALAQLPIEEVRMRIRQVELQLQEGHMSLARLQQERDAARITQVELQLQVKSSELTSMRVQLEKEQHRASHVAAQADVAGAVTEQQKARLAEKATELETQLVRAGFPRGHGTDVATRLGVSVAPLFTFGSFLADVDLPDAGAGAAASLSGDVDGAVHADADADASAADLDSQVGSADGGADLASQVGSADGGADGHHSTKSRLRAEIEQERQRAAVLQAALAEAGGPLAERPAEVLQATYQRHMQEAAGLNKALDEARAQGPARMTKKQRRLASKIEQSLACAKATAAALQNAKPASAYAHHEADSAEPALAEVKQADSEKKNRRFGASEETNYPTSAW